MGHSEHPPPDPRILPPGALFHQRYQVEQLIGAGALGAVYRVTDQRTKHARALKVMRPIGAEEGSLRERFLQEATITAEIDSEHIALTTDAGIDAETSLPFLAMELLRGEPLASRMRRLGRRPPGEVITLLSQAARALDRTHAAGVVHRDLKPENLFVTHRDDGSLCLKILDFGMAKLMSQLGERTASIAGTPKYMAPEQFDGQASPRSDRYALAQLAYHMLVGSHYWSEDFARGGPLLQIALVMQQGPTEAASVRASRAGATLPEAFDAWFDQATASDPESRFDSSADLALGLVSALEGDADVDEEAEEPAPERAPIAQASVATAKRARWGVWAGIFAIATASVFLFAVFHSSGQGDERAAAATSPVREEAIAKSEGDTSAPPLAKAEIVSPVDAAPEDATLGAPPVMAAAPKPLPEAEATKVSAPAEKPKGAPEEARAPKRAVRTFDQEDGPTASDAEF